MKMMFVRLKLVIVVKWDPTRFYPSKWFRRWAENTRAGGDLCADGRVS